MTCEQRCCPINFGRYRATAEADGSNLIVTLVGFCPELLIQGDRVNFYIDKCISYPTTKINNVKISVNGSEFTAIKIGNVKWDQLKARQNYCGVFGTESPTITILNDLPCSKFDYPTYTTNCNTFEKVEA